MLERGIRWLIDPIKEQSFFENYYERRPLVINRADPNYFVSLLSLDDIDGLITQHDLDYPDLALANAEKSTCCTSVGALTAFREFSAGTSIVLSGMHRRLPTL